MLATSEIRSFPFNEEGVEQVRETISQIEDMMK